MEKGGLSKDGFQVSMFHVMEMFLQRGNKGKTKSLIQSIGEGLFLREVGKLLLLTGRKMDFGIL